MKALLSVLLLTLSACEQQATWRGPDWQPKESKSLDTVQHQGHWFIVRNGGAFMHHPDCPLCESRKEKSNEKIERPAPTAARP